MLNQGQGSYSSISSPLAAQPVIDLLLRQLLMVKVLLLPVSDTWLAMKPCDHLRYMSNISGLSWVVMACQLFHASVELSWAKYALCAPLKLTHKHTHLLEALHQQVGSAVAALDLCKAQPSSGDDSIGLRNLKNGTTFAPCWRLTFGSWFFGEKIRFHSSFIILIWFLDLGSAHPRYEASWQEVTQRIHPDHIRHGENARHCNREFT